MRKAVYVAVAVLAVLVLAGLSSLVYLQRTHPRDESAFLDYVGSHGGEQGQSLARADLPSADALITEGDRACHWLGNQPYALWRHGAAFRHQTLLDRYVGQPDLGPLTWADSPDREIVARAAWRSLCPAAWDLHRPHFHEPGGD